MLRVTVISSAAKAESYYSQADYYLDEDAVPARWHGKGAEQLGIHGEVAFEHFSALCRNRHPLSKEQITASDREGRRVGYDLTFSVSKSLSVLYALAGDDRILNAFRDSVKFTMEHIEADAAVRVRKQGQDTDRIVGNLVYSDFVHTLSRPVGDDLLPSLNFLPTNAMSNLRQFVSDWLRLATCWQSTEICSSGSFLHWRESRVSTKRLIQYSVVTEFHWRRLKRIAPPLFIGGPTKFHNRGDSNV